jgi:putative transposase
MKYLGGMPRQARIDAPGALHHIVIRGIERRGIFKGREDFLERLSSLLQETATPRYAWAPMTNRICFCAPGVFRSLRSWDSS